MYSEDGRYVPAVVDHIRGVRIAAAKAGYYSMSVPVELGGAGMGMLAYFVVWERIYRMCGSHNWLGAYAVSHWAFGPSPVLLKVTDRARSEILAGMMEGRTSMCFGMSEPGAGSDATMIRTKARQTDSGWRLNGRKIWTTNAPQADYCIVFAVTDPDRASCRAGGISAVLVPTASPGFRLESVIRMHGAVGGNKGSIVLEDVQVEPWQLVGELHEGFRIGLLGVSIGRIYNSARAVGLGRWAIEAALRTHNGVRLSASRSRIPGRDVSIGRSGDRAACGASFRVECGGLDRPRRAGGEGAIDGQGLCGGDRCPGAGSRYPNSWRHGFHQRA